MRLEAGLVDPLEALLLPSRHDSLRIGLLVPQRGALGMLAPSVIDAALLAAHELNVAGGVTGARVELVVLDGGRDPAAVADETAALASAGAVSAVVAFCASDVHLAVARRLAGRTAYVYTPPHEGGPVGPSAVCLGPGPSEQLAGAVGWLTAVHQVRRWALVGSDYVWPWAVHRAARRVIAGSAATVVLEELVPHDGLPHGLDRVVDTMVDRKVDGVLVSLVGQDQVAFHRAMRHTGLDRRAVRLSGAFEENALLAVGGDATGLLYAAMPSFASLDDDVHLDLVERHAAVLGPRAPVLDSYAEAVYDGLMLVGRVAALDGLRADDFATAVARMRPAVGRGVRLARAVGPDFTVLHDTGAQITSIWK